MNSNLFLEHVRVIFLAQKNRTIITLSAMDVLAPTTMKNAAKCDTSCELQNPVSHQNFERNLHFLGSMSVGVSVHTHPNLTVCGAGRLRKVVR